MPRASATTSRSRGPRAGPSPLPCRTPRRGGSTGGCSATRTRRTSAGCAWCADWLALNYHVTREPDLRAGRAPRHSRWMKRPSSSRPAPDLDLLRRVCPLVRAGGLAGLVPLPKLQWFGPVGGGLGPSGVAPDPACHDGGGGLRLPSQDGRWPDLPRQRRVVTGLPIRGERGRAGARLHARGRRRRAARDGRWVRGGAPPRAPRLR